MLTLLVLLHVRAPKVWSSRSRGKPNYLTSTCSTVYAAASIVLEHQHQKSRPPCREMSLIPRLVLLVEKRETIHPAPIGFVQTILRGRKFQQRHIRVVMRVLERDVDLLQLVGLHVEHPVQRRRGGVEVLEGVQHPI